MRELAASFTQREVLPHLDDWEQAGLVPRALHEQAAAAGLLGAGFPEAVGGSGGDAVDVAIVTETMIEAGASSGLLAALFTHGIALPHLVAAGDPDLVARYVRPTLAGERIGALAVTEPDGGSDVANIRTRAVREGSSYRVSGAKTYITSGVRADFLTTLVRTGDVGHHGLSLLVIDTAAAGCTVVRQLDKMGWRCSDTAELAFTDVEVPTTNLVGPEGGGFIQVAQQFAGERLALAVHAYAIALRCIALSVTWARERTAFGAPLIGKQVVRHRLVDMTRRAAVVASYTRSILDRYATGRECFAEAALAKNAAVEACAAVVDAAVQLHGGLGYMTGTEVERHYRDARILGIGGGATEVMNDLVARALDW